VGDSVCADGDGMQLQERQTMTDINETQKGIDTRLAEAGDRVRKLQEVYFANPTPENEKAYEDAMEELRQLRSVPMKSLASLAPKRFVRLRE
jgi:hypothetical protein